MMNRNIIGNFEVFKRKLRDSQVIGFVFYVWKRFKIKVSKFLYDLIWKLILANK